MDSSSVKKRPKVNTASREYTEMLAGFRVYLLPSGAADALPAPRAYTCYRGVPVACEAKVVDADNAQVTFKVNRYQCNALTRTEFALIKSPLHGMTFRAYLNRVDTDSELASFDLFERHGEGAERRGNVRFQPLEDNDITMQFGRTKVVGQLLDVSVSAIAVFINDADPALLQEGETANLQLTVAGAGAFSLKAKGTVQRVLAWAGDDPNDFRVVLQLDLNDKDQETIAGYVADQQMQVLQAMNQ